MIQKQRNFMACALSIGLVGLLAVILTTQPCLAASDSAVVEVSITVASYLDVGLVSPELILNPVTAVDFYNDDPPYPILHSDSSPINLRSNVACSLRVREDLELTHSSGDPSVDLSAIISLVSNSVAHLVNDGGVYYWVLNFVAGDHPGASEVSVSVRQVWTAAHTAGLYSGQLTLEVLEGTF